VTCLHPSLEPVLARTLGVPLFQEQLLRMAMIAARFSGGEAEELRRAFGFKRSEKRMKDVELKLRRGMDKNGISGETQETIIRSITSFALYGFPESHAASFALIAYASAYLKCHYLAAFTAAMLNNQPMGFYQPPSLVTDAQRHGLRVRPIDITCSNWLCALEKIDGKFAVRLGLRYVKGLRAEIGAEIVRERAARPFTSVDDLKRRVPRIQKGELAVLAEVGALNRLGNQRGFHRRSALWQVERTARAAGPLYELCDHMGKGEEQTVSHGSADESLGENYDSALSPLAQMNAEERLVADFRGTGMTVGPHPMAYHRA
jgi:error-prone DNA polymerase